MVQRNNGGRRGNQSTRRAQARRRPANPQGRNVLAPTNQVHTTRSFWKLATDNLQLLSATTQEEVAGSVLDTKFGNAALSMSLEEYFDTTSSAGEFLRTVDQFRVDSIDIYCDASKIPFAQQFRRVMIYYKADFDDNNVIDWYQMQQRDGVMLRYLSPTDSPMIKLCTIRPAADFRSTALTGDPSNMVPRAAAWFDCVAIKQNFIGLKIHVEVNSPSSETLTPQVSFPMKANFSFRGQV